MHLTNIDVFSVEYALRVDLHHLDSPRRIKLLSRPSMREGMKKGNGDEEIIPIPSEQTIEKFNQMVDPLVGLFTSFEEVEHKHFPYQVYEIKYRTKKNGISLEQTVLGCGLTPTEAKVRAIVQALDRLKRDNKWIDVDANKWFILLGEVAQQLEERHKIETVTSILQEWKEELQWRDMGVVDLESAEMDSKSYFILKSLQMRFMTHLELKYVDVSHLYEESSLLIYLIILKAEKTDYFLLQSDLNIKWEEILISMYQNLLHKQYDLPLYTADYIHCESTLLKKLWSIHTRLVTEDPEPDPENKTKRTLV